MITVLLNSGSHKELKYIEDYTQYLASRLSGDGWEYHAFNSMKEVLAFLSDCPILDIACVDLTLQGGIEGAKRIRNLNGNTFMLVIADKNVSPMSYVSSFASL